MLFVRLSLVSCFFNSTWRQLLTCQQYVCESVKWPRCCHVNSKSLSTNWSAYWHVSSNCASTNAFRGQKWGCRRHISLRHVLQLQLYNWITFQSCTLLTDITPLLDYKDQFVHPFFWSVLQNGRSLMNGELEGKRKEAACLHRGSLGAKCRDLNVEESGTYIYHCVPER